MTDKKLTPSEIEELIDEAIADKNEERLEELEAYFSTGGDAEHADERLPFGAVVSYNPDLVDTEGEVHLEGWFSKPAMWLANKLSRGRRDIRYFARKNAKGVIRLVTEGDSWFQYPVKLADVVDALSPKGSSWDDVWESEGISAGFAICSLGAAGDTLENMSLQREFVKAIRDEKPSFFLFSAGGNDILDSAVLAQILKKYVSGMAAKELIENEILDDQMEQIRGRIRTIIQTALIQDPDLHILSHGYDYVIPDPKGPWIGTVMKDKKIPLSPIGNELTKILVDRLNEILSDLEDEFQGRYHHVNLRGKVGSKNAWFDEIHPHNPGYERCARQFVVKMRELLVRPMPERRFAATAVVNNNLDVNELSASLDKLLSREAAFIGGPPNLTEATNVLAKKVMLQGSPDVAPDEQACSCDCQRQAREHHERVSSSEMREAMEHVVELLAESDEKDSAARRQVRRQLVPEWDKTGWERIIGESNLYPFSFLASGSRAGRAVAKVEIGTAYGVIGSGTGALIAPGYLITNHHVIENEGVAGYSFVRFDYEKDEKGLDRETHLFRILGTGGVFCRELDFTIVRVEEVNEKGKRLSDFGHVHLIRESGKATKRECINIIQHPRGEYKQLAMRESMIIGVKEHFIYYTTDTLPGSSGAVVFNDMWNPVALHHKTIPHPDRPGEFIANRGIRISSIFAELERLASEGGREAAGILRLLGGQKIERRESEEREFFVKGSLLSELLTSTPEQPGVSPEERAEHQDWEDANPDLAEKTFELEEEDQGSESEAFFENNGPRRSSAEVSWVNHYQNNPDYSHLPPEAEGVTFDLTASTLQKHIELAHYHPESGGHGKIILGLRGLALADGSRKAENRISIRVRETKPNHRNFRCLMGVFDTRAMTISLYQGSTVPNAFGVKEYYNLANGHGGRKANCLPTGFYEYYVGTHNGWAEGALRLRESREVSVLRSSNDVTYGTQDFWDRCVPNDNIHPSTRLNSFSSLGCLTVRGLAHTDEWEDFRDNAGFDHTNDGVRYNLVLVSGMELSALTIALNQNDSAGLARLRTLRYGSKGDEVARLQAELGISESGVDGDFGAGTQQRLIRLQQQILSDRATAILNQEMAAALGIGWPGSGGGTVAPIPQPIVVPELTNPWLDVPRMSSSDWHRQFGGRRWRYDHEGIYIDGNSYPQRTGGDPSTCREIIRLMGNEILAAAVKYEVPPELILMTIATESAFKKDEGFTGPGTFRWESHAKVYHSGETSLDGHHRGDYSAGPMQTLADTARWVIDSQDLNYKPLEVAPFYRSQPSPKPASHPLYEYGNNVDLGTAEIHQRWTPSGDDPIKVSAIFNAGSLRMTESNLWHIRSHGNHLDRAARWFGDACFVLADLRSDS